MIRDLGGETKQVVAIAPVTASTGTLTGVAIDRLGYTDSVFSFVRGEGTADNAFTFTGHIEESDDVNTGWGDVEEVVNVAKAITAMTYDSDANAIVNLRVDLRNRKRYIRAVSTVAMTGSLAVAVICTLGRTDVVPAV